MRWAVIALVILGTLAAFAVGALMFLPTDRIATVAANRIAQATGRSVEISGAVRPTLFPSLGVRAERFVIGNPDWVEAGPMISAEALTISVPWRAVFGSGIEIEEVTLSAPEIILVRAADGRTSWTFSQGATPRDVIETSDAETPDETDAAPDGALRLALDAATLTDGALTYLDLADDTRIDLSGVSAEVALPADGAARLAAAATINGTAAEFTAEVDGLTDLLAGAVRPVTAAVAWDGGTADFDGRIAPAPAAEGRLTVDARDLGPLFALIGAPAPDLPAGLGRDRIAASGQITLTEAGTLHLRQGDLRLDETALAVDLDVTLGGERPNLRGTVTGAALTLPMVDADSGGAPAASGASGGTAPAAGGWSTAPIDVSALFAADAEIGLRLDRLVAGDTTIAPFNARVVNDAGRAVVDIENAGLYGGTLAGQVVVNGRSGLSARTDLIFAGVELQPLLSATAGFDRLQGAGSISVQLLGVGDSVAALMASLEGQGDLAFGSGAILGLDIAGMIRNFDTSFQGDGARTVFDSVTGNFTVARGVLSNDDLDLQAPWGGITGAGRVDIGARTLEYRVIPGLIRGEDGGTDINIPVLISGPWAGPSFQPDLAFLAEQEFAEEAARLEDAARGRVEEAVRDGVSDALGVDLSEETELDQIGPAIDDALRQEAENALQRLLGGGD